jgi:hypothetical protein
MRLLHYQQCLNIAFLYLMSLEHYHTMFAMETTTYKLPPARDSFENRRHRTDRDLEKIVELRKARNQVLADYGTHITYNSSINKPLSGKFSHIEGVTWDMLETARDRTMRNVPTSCAAIIRSRFGDAAPAPLNHENKVVTDLEAQRELMFLHIPKNGSYYDLFLCFLIFVIAQRIPDSFSL